MFVDPQLGVRVWDVEEQESRRERSLTPGFTSRVEKKRKKKQRSTDQSGAKNSAGRVGRTFREECSILDLWLVGGLVEKNSRFSTSGCTRSVEVLIGRK
jgi:hypothetical protein